MSASDWFAIAIVMFCLLFSAAFAGSETALTASSRATMLQLAKQGDRRAAIVNRLLETRERLISALLIGNNSVNIVAFTAPDRFALAVARPIAWTVRLLTPALAAIEALVNWLLRRFGMQVGEGPAMLSPHEELRGAVDLLHREGGVEKHDRDMFSGLLDLRDLTVSDVM